MKILPLVKGIQKDIASSGIRLKKATSDGYNVADRTSRIYKQGKLKKYLNVTRCVTEKVVSGTTVHELPYIGAAIGFVTPIPFMSLIMFVLGFLVRIPSDGAHIMYDKMSKQHHIDING